MPHITQEDNRIDYIEFAVSDVERAKAFYGKAFGWTFTDYGPQYCEFTDGRIKGGFDAMSEVRPGGALVVLYHSNLEEASKSVIEAGGKISKEIFQFPGGERFQFTDPDGHELAVWRTL